MHRKTIVSLIISFILTASAAQASMPAAYYLQSSAFSAGSGSGTSPSYTNFGITGQGQPIESSSSTGYKSDAGFIPVLGGWKLLYPVIAVNPSTLTFTLANTEISNQSVGVGNDGGSTLQWSSSKAGNSPWLAVTPSSGTGPATLSVTADANALVPGIYQETININGSGAPNSASFVVTLNVKSNFELAVTISSGTGFGTGSVNSNPAGIACSSESNTNCSKQYPDGTVVTLTPTPTSGSAFGSWSGVCSGSGSGSCQVAMNGPQSVTVSFTPNPATVRVSGNNTSYYAINPALDSVAIIGQTVSGREQVFVENVIMTSPVAIMLKGGYTDDAFTTRTPTSITVIDGSLKIRSGTLRVERLKVR